MVFAAASLGLAVLLKGCGGGSDPPSISLSAIPTSGKVGETITLSATADHDKSIKDLRMYRVTSNSEELLVTFTAAPFLFQTLIPTGASGTVQYRARVKDTDDQETTSNTVTVNVTN